MVSEQQRHPMSSTRAAGLIGTGFGTVFVLVNAGANSSPWDVVLRVLGVLAAAGSLVTLLRRPDRPVSPRPGALRVYWACVLAEVVALVVGSRLLAAHGHGEYGVAWVALVVGVHFLPFAWAFRVPGFGVLGAAMVGLAALGTVLGLAGAGSAAVALVAGVGTGFTLVAFAASSYAVGGRAVAPAGQTRA